MNKLYAVLTAATVTLICACSDSSDSRPAPTPLLDRYVLSSEDSVPEGVAFDPVERMFYATSLQGGSIVRLTADGQESVFRAADGRALLGGAAIDSGERRLWVCAQQVDGLDNRVWVFDLASGDMKMEFLLGALSTGGSCNDLVLDENGIAYVTDPANPFIYRLDPQSGTGDILATDPLFQDITGISLGLNGIEITPDGSALIVAKFAPASLLRVSLPAADDIQLISLTGDELPSPDGLAFLAGNLYSVSNSSVNRMQFDTGFTAATVDNAEQISGLSTAATVDQDLYVIKSDVTNFATGQPLDTPFEIFRVDLSTFDQ